MKVKAILFLITFGALLLYNCGNVTEVHDHHNGHEPTVIKLQAAIVKKIGLELGSVRPIYLKKRIQLSGRVISNRDKLQIIAPRYTGLVTRVYKKLGDNVTAGTALARIQNNATLSAYTVSALISGTIIEKNIAIGNMVNDNHTIFKITNLNHIWIELDAYGKNISDIHKGQNVIVEGISNNLKTNSKISYVSPVLDEQRKSFIVRIVLPNKEKKWHPGTFVRGIIVNQAAEKVMCVRVDAVQNISEKNVVFISKNENEFTPVIVDLGDNDGTYVHIKKGVKPDDVYVLKGAYDLKWKLETKNVDSHAGHGH